MFIAFLAVVMATALADPPTPLLSAWAPPLDVLAVPAWSRRLPPVYTGATPREFAARQPPSDPTRRHLPSHAMRALGSVTPELFAVLPSTARYVELYPTYDDDTGLYTWVVARWAAGSGNWVWLPANANASFGVFPQVLDVDSNATALFAPASLQDDLYAQPSAGNCVWIDASGAIAAAWINPELQMDWIRERATAHGWFNGKPESYVGVVLGSSLVLPDMFTWEPPLPLPRPTCPPVEVPFAAQFTRDWSGDVASLANYTHKSSGDAHNGLAAVRKFLRAVYEQQLGLATFEVDASSYLGIADSVLIAVLPGSDPLLPPLLLCDHYDTAYDEDVFAANGTRVSAPGADDNASASATLLSCARTLLPLARRRTVWLVHLCGEEFPADDLGARALDTFLLAKNTSVAGVVVLDMIAWRSNATDRVVQINAGRSAASVELSSCFMSVSSPLVPTWRGRWDARSYLYNTDAAIFDASGWPSLLVNEHLNAIDNWGRPYYHQSTDTLAHIDVGYGSEVAKLVIQGVARLVQ